MTATPTVMTGLRPAFGVLLVLCVARSVSAQGPKIQCVANNAGDPPIVRSQGLAEPVDDLILNCTGDSTTLSALAELKLLLNTPIGNNTSTGPATLSIPTIGAFI